MTNHSQLLHEVISKTINLLPEIVNQTYFMFILQPTGLIMGW